MHHKRVVLPLFLPQDTAQDLWSTCLHPTTQRYQECPGTSRQCQAWVPVTNAKSALGTSSKMCVGERLCQVGDSTLRKPDAFFPLPLPSYQGLSVFELLKSSPLPWVQVPLPEPWHPHPSSRRETGVPKPGQFGRDLAPVPVASQ